MGKHTLLVTTATRNAKAAYSFNIWGNVSNLKKIESQSKIIQDVWARGTSHSYSINVTEDSSPLDISLQSPDYNCSFELYDPLGQKIKWYDIYNDRYEFTIEYANKVVYKIVTSPLVQPINQPSSMKYTLSVYGKFTDFKKL